jgi:EmrB/QacA subfamily drug resistance transporter
MSRWRGNPWAILLTLSLGFFMTLLDLTIVNIAIPNMIDKLNASLDEVLWVLNGYILILAVLLITFGRLGDLRGPRNLFILGVAVFTVASLLCGLSQNPAELIGARVIQGVGAALLMPQTMTLIISTFPPEGRGAAMGIWGAVAGLATIAGPTVGGLLVSVLDWRWIFFVNLPVGVVVLVLAVGIIPDIRPGAHHRLDWTGVVIASTALFMFTFALTEGQRYDWNAWIWGLMAAAAMVLAGFLLQQRARQGNEPLVPFAIFRDRSYTVMGVVSAAVSVGMIGFFLPTTIYFQSVLGYSALKAGLVMCPASLVSMPLAPLAGRLTDRFGGKYILLGGLSLYAIGCAWMVSIAEPDSDWYIFLAPMIVAGVGIGFLFAPMVTIAMQNVEPRMAGAASGVLNTVRQVGSVIGSAAVGALLQHQLASSLTSEATKRSAALPAQYRGQFVDGFRHAAKGGLELGPGQSASKPPAGLPQEVAALLGRLGKDVFGHGFVTAMRTAVALPIVLMFLAAATCLLLKARPKDTPARPGPETIEAGLPG